jgi:hypothetical protein
MSEHTEVLYFSTTGDFVTNTARDWLYAEKRPYDKVIDFLLSCMEGTDLDRDELISLAHDVLLGKRKFIGTTKDDSFCLVEDNTDIIKMYPFAFENKPAPKFVIEDDPPNPLATLKNRVHTASKRRKNKPSSAMIRNVSTEDYGWLRPDGKFFETGWGTHEEWAGEYIDKYYPNARPHYSGDFLVKKGWILLHSPTQTGVSVSMDDINRASKKQKEFLYDYFVERNRREDASAVWKDVV